MDVGPLLRISGSSGHHLVPWSQGLPYGGNRSADISIRRNRAASMFWVLKITASLALGNAILEISPRPPPARTLVIFVIFSRLNALPSGSCVNLDTILWDFGWFPGSAGCCAGPQLCPHELQARVVAWCAPPEENDLKVRWNRTNHFILTRAQSLSWAYLPVFEIHFNQVGHQF